MCELWYLNLVVGMVFEKYNFEKGLDVYVVMMKVMRECWIREEFSRYCGFIFKRVVGGKFFCGDWVMIVDCVLVLLLCRFCSGGIDYVFKECFDVFVDVVAYYEKFYVILEVVVWYVVKLV